MPMTGAPLYLLVLAAAADAAGGDLAGRTDGTRRPERPAREPREPQTNMTRWPTDQQRPERPTREPHAHANMTRWPTQSNVTGRPTERPEREPHANMTRWPTDPKRPESPREPHTGMTGRPTVHPERPERPDHLEREVDTNRTDRDGPQHPHREVGFNCEEMRAPWMHEQREHCCATEGVGCRPPREVQEEARCRDPGLAATPSVGCCRKFGRRCAAEAKYDCFSGNRGEWGASQQRWCCRNKNVCLRRCVLGKVQEMAPEDQTACCETAGVCVGGFFAGTEDARSEARGKTRGHRRGVEMKVEGTADDLLTNPMHTLLKVRRAILSATEGLAPEELSIELIGALMPDGSLPDGAQWADWTVQFPPAANDDLMDDEHAMLKAIGRRLAGGSENVAPAPVPVEASRRAAGILGVDVDQGLFWQGFVEGASEDDSASLEAAVQNGRYDPDSEYSLAMAGLEASKDGPQDGAGAAQESEKNWAMWITAGMLAALGVGAAVAAAVKKRGKYVSFDDVGSSAGTPADAFELETLADRRLSLVAHEHTPPPTDVEGGLIPH